MFYEIFTLLCKHHGMKPTTVLQKLKISTSKLTAWKKGSLPSANVLILHMHNSNIGAVGHNISGTINIGNDSSAPETNSSDNTSISSDNDEMSEELLRIFKALPLKERTKIMSKVYELEDEYIKKK